MKIQDQLNKNKPVAVPDVRLLARPLAVTQIQNAGLIPRVIKAPSDTVPSGQVSDQNPGGGSKVARGSTVTLTVSSGIPQVRVPNVVGQDVTSAVQALAQVGLQPKIVRIYSTAQTDTVTAQQPASGDLIPKGETVRINVSRGAKPVQVPDVTGQPFANARSALQGQGFVVVRIDIQSDQAKGVVVQSDPPAGSSVDKGSKVTLSVSKGPATTQVPNQADATLTLQQAGLNVAVIMDPVTDPSQDGIVISTDPAPGADATSGETITIHVGQLTATTPGGDGTGTTTTLTTP
jgi:serine/threonine-protein kinase